MTTTLSTIRDRVEAFLVDSSNLSFSTTTLDEGIRQALGDLSRTYGANLVLSGLDGASTTTVELMDESALVLGAAAYAAKSRSIDRAERANLANGVPSTLLEWGRQHLAKFEDRLREIRRRKIANGTSIAATWEWNEENEEEWNMRGGGHA
jgi:hypothetical protein